MSLHTQRPSVEPWYKRVGDGKASLLRLGNANKNNETNEVCWANLLLRCESWLATRNNAQRTWQLFRGVFLGQKKVGNPSIRFVYDLIDLHKDWRLIYREICEFIVHGMGFMGIWSRMTGGWNDIYKQTR